MEWLNMNVHCWNLLFGLRTHLLPFITRGAALRATYVDARGAALRTTQEKL